ncbi:cornichon [Abortiporus biennis]|nr:cornichon [Abortiporus biennis]
MADSWVLFLFALLFAAGLAFATTFFIVYYADLESDYINPMDFCETLNRFVLPEIYTHGFLSVLLLLFGQWSAFAINAPLVAFNVYKYSNGDLLYDPTEIFRNLRRHKKESFGKLIFYLFTFFYYLYRLIVALVSIPNA